MKAQGAGAGAGVGQSLPWWLSAVPGSTAACEETDRSIRSNQLPPLIWECSKSTPETPELSHQHKQLYTGASVKVNDRKWLFPLSKPDHTGCKEQEKAKMFNHTSTMQRWEAQCKGMLWQITHGRFDVAFPEDSPVLHPAEDPIRSLHCTKTNTAQKHT